jgi:uncharacterized damage-inducible protein DinB
MPEVRQQEYAWVVSERAALFDSLERMPPAKLREAVPGFGHGSIARSLVRGADSFRLWPGSFAFRQKPGELRESDVGDLAAVRALFAGVGAVVARCFRAYSGRQLEEIRHEAAWRERPWFTSPPRLLAHVEVQELHHRGHIMVMARSLGYRSHDGLGSLFR